MEPDLSAKFKALGDPTRLRIYTFLRNCCCEVEVDEEGVARPVCGPTVGEVCCSITGSEKVSSTISFHLKELRQAGLIRMERRGKNMVCGIEPAALESLQGFFANSPIPTDYCPTP